MDIDEDGGLRSTTRAMMPLFASKTGAGIRNQAKQSIVVEFMNATDGPAWKEMP